MPELFGPGGLRTQFLETFANSGRLTENPTTILQALTLMNGGQVGSATTKQTGRLLKALLDLPARDPDERIERLYFAVLGRAPRPTEMSRTLAYVKEAGAGSDRAYSDILWVLLNGIEFRTNH